MCVIDPVRLWGGIINAYRGRPIFILGCPRSGTTMLGLMLQAHPRIAIPPENRFVLPVYYKRARFGDLRRAKNRRRMAKMIVGSRWFSNLGLDSDEIVARIVAEASTVGSAVGLVLRAYADEFGKVRWGDKRPAYHNHVRVIQRMFPDAQFVSLVRDGRDCVASLKKLPGGIGNESTHRLVQEWMLAVDQGNDLRRELPSDTFLELQYEKLVGEPKAQLAALCEFLGEQYDDAMLRPEEIAEKIIPDRQSWHANTRHEVSSSSVGKFEEGLERWELELCEAVMGDHLRDYGYELTGVAPPSDAQLAEYRRVDAARRKELREREEQDLELEDYQPVVDAPPTKLHEAKDHPDAKLQRQVSSLRAERDALKQQLDRILRSRSWRWTWPLRSVRRSVRQRRS